MYISLVPLSRMTAFPLLVRLRAFVYCVFVTSAGATNSSIDSILRCLSSSNTIISLDRTSEVLFTTDTWGQ